MHTNSGGTRHFPIGRRTPGMFPQQQPHMRRVANIANLSLISGGGRSGNAISTSLHVDRHRTIRLVCPLSNMVVCTRLDRVIPTFAKAQSGAAVCEDFLDNQSCPFLESCCKVHVLKEHTWNYITAGVNESTGLFEPGFTVHCYGPRMEHYYPIRSEYVLKTRGSLDYVKMYNEHGDNFKGKFRLCEDMLNCGKCNMGEACDDIHAIRNDVWNMESNTTHIFEHDMLARYPRLPSRIVVRAFEQNSKDCFVDFPGDQVLQTLGSRQYLTAFEAEGTIPKKKMQHCAHFRTNRLCRRGESCRFLHVVLEKCGSPGNSLAGDACSNNITSGDSPNSDLTVNPRVRQPTSGMSAGQVALMVGQRFVSGSDAALLNFSQGADCVIVNPAGLVLREEPQTKNDVVAAPSVSSRRDLSNQSLSDTSGRMRMISPTRRNNPYAMSQGSE